jgi:hypothetical protein
MGKGQPRAVRLRAGRFASHLENLVCPLTPERCGPSVDRSERVVYKVHQVGETEQSDHRVAATQKLGLTTVMSDFGPFVCFEGYAMTWRLRRFGAHQRSDLAMLLSFVRRET